MSEENALDPAQLDKKLAEMGSKVKDIDEIQSGGEEGNEGIDVDVDDSPEDLEGALDHFKPGTGMEDGEDGEDRGGGSVRRGGWGEDGGGCGI